MFDALTSVRPYKKSFSLEKTIGIMEEGRGEFFDPDLLTIFLNNMESFVAIKDALKDEHESALPLNTILNADY